MTWRAISAAGGGMVAPEPPYPDRVATDGRRQCLIEKRRDESVAERARYRERRGIRRVAMQNNSLPPQSAQDRLRDENQYGRRQPHIVNAIEPLTDKIEIHPAERKIQQNARNGRLQNKSK